VLCGPKIGQKPLNYPGIWRATDAHDRDNRPALTRNCGLTMAVGLFCEMVHVSSLARN